MTNEDLIRAVITDCGSAPTMRDFAEIADMYDTTLPAVYRIWESSESEFGIRNSKAASSTAEPVRPSPEGKAKNSVEIKEKRNEVNVMKERFKMTEEIVRQIDVWREDGIKWDEIAERLGHTNKKSLNIAYINAKKRMGEVPAKTSYVTADGTASAEGKAEKTSSTGRAGSPSRRVPEHEFAECLGFGTEGKPGDTSDSTASLKREIEPRFASIIPELADVLRAYGYEGSVRRMTVDYRTGGLILLCRDDEGCREFTVCVSEVSDEQEE